MKRLIFPLVLILVVTAGCLYKPPAANIPPTAYIDSVSPVNATCGQAVTFTGHGIDPDGTIGAYSWRSSRDGDLSTAPSFSTSTLSPGTHTIWFKVQDNDGQWSPEVLATVIAIPAGAGKPVINSFNASPGSISPGGSATLSWDVTGCTTVNIEPGIGDVGLNGTRIVVPTKDTTYILTAINEAGISAASTQVVVRTTVNKIILYSIAAEDGQVRRDGYVGQEPDVGDLKTGVNIEAFLSFDISSIPKGAEIDSVALDLTEAAMLGDPFSNLGPLRIYVCQYKILSTRDYADSIAIGDVYLLSRPPSQPLTSSFFVNSIQKQVDEGNPRFQLRFQFTQMGYYRINDMYLSLGSGRTKLTIEYH
jgi:PKD domain